MAMDKKGKWYATVVALPLQLRHRDHRRHTVRHSSQLLFRKACCRQVSVCIAMPATPMRPTVKALRAQWRREDAAQFNRQLESAILNKSNCLKGEKRTSARRLHLICIVCCQSFVRALCS